MTTHGISLIVFIGNKKKTANAAKILFDVIDIFGDFLISKGHTWTLRNSFVSDSAPITVNIDKEDQLASHVNPVYSDDTGEVLEYAKMGAYFFILGEENVHPIHDKKYGSLTISDFPRRAEFNCGYDTPEIMKMRLVNVFRCIQMGLNVKAGF